MKHAIRKHLRDFLAILVLVVIGLGVAAYITSNQRLYLPAWVPGVGTDFYELEAEFPTAQAVVPGQGQTVDIAGVPVGEIGEVRLRNGVAVVQMKIRKKYAPVYRDASLLLRPKTGLKDMIIEMDPGTPKAGAYKEGETISVDQTSPDVNLDEILGALDGDTRSYLVALVSAGGQALGQPGAPADLRETFKRFEPTSRDVEHITQELAKRRRNTRRVIHNFRLLTEELGDKDTQLAELVDSSNANFKALANQDANLRAALRELPPTLEQAKTTLGKTTTLANELGPTMTALRPTARELGPALRETRPFLRLTTPIIRDQLRPFARDAQPAVRELRTAAERLQPVTPRLTRRSASSTRCSTRSPTTRPATRRATCSGPRGSTTRARRSSPPRTRTARSAAVRSSLRAPRSACSRTWSRRTRSSRSSTTCSRRRPTSEACPRPIGPGVPEQGTPGTNGKSKGPAPRRRPRARAAPTAASAPRAPPTAGQPARASPTPSSPRREVSAREQGVARLRPAVRDGRVRVLVLRDPALPVGHVRRLDPARGQGLPDQGPVPRGDHARQRVRRAHLGREGRRGQDEGARQEGRRHDRRARDRARVRAAAREHAGDPAPEDAARRDLRRADAGIGVGEEDPRRRHARARPGRRHRPARRDLPLVRPVDAARVPDLARPAGQGGRRPRPRAQRGARQPDPVRRGRERAARDPQRAEGGDAHARARHGRRLRRAVGARRPAGRPDHELEPGLRDDRLARPRARGDLPRSCRPSSTRAA